MKTEKRTGLRRIDEVRVDPILAGKKWRYPLFFKANAEISLLREVV
jgi:hypothetical protein